MSTSDRTEFWRTLPLPARFIKEHAGPNRKTRRAHVFGADTAFCEAHDTQLKRGTGQCQRCRRGRSGLVKPIARNETIVTKRHHWTYRLADQRAA